MAGDDRTGQEPTGLWCQWCGQGVTRGGQFPDGDDGLSRVVHAATGLEQAPDGHLAAPLGHEPLRMSALRAAGGAR